MLHFDVHGHLTPHEIIEATWEEFSTCFAENMENQQHRKNLLGQYQNYLNEIKSTFSVPFYQWVNGSFVTQKTFPGDIYMVTFLPYDLIVQKAIFVQQLRKTSKQLYKIDGFFAPTARWNHRFHDSCQKEADRWIELFGTSREGLSKGIIKLNFAA